MVRLVLVLLAAAAFSLPRMAFAESVAIDAGSTYEDAGAYDADGGSLDVDDAYADDGYDGFEETTPACYYDSDCGPCAACISGQCQGMGAVVCYNDSDCGNGMTCLANPGEPCKNACVPAAPSCQTSNDCPACNKCIAGTCTPAGDFMCKIDADCGTGMTCVMQVCSSICATKPECSKDGDCGPCAGCVGGQCKGLGLVICTVDAQCGSGMKCNVVVGAPCQNSCVLAPQPDAGSTDTASKDSTSVDAPPADAKPAPDGQGLPDLGTDGGPDVAASKDVATGSDSSAGLDASGTGSDGGGADGSQAPDSTGLTGYYTPAPVSACSAAPVGHVSGWAWLLALLGLTPVLCRRRVH